MNESIHYSFDPIFNDSKSKYFSTYYCDIYLGSVPKITMVDDRFYILPNLIQSKYLELKPNEQIIANCKIIEINFDNQYNKANFVQ